MRAIWGHGAWSDATLSRGRWPGSRNDGDENIGGDIEDKGEHEYKTDEGENNDDEDVEGDVEEGERDNIENNKSEDDKRSVGYGSEDEHQQGELCNNASAAADKLKELVFRLCVTFSTEEFVDSQPS
jgi:hypothetical protein